MLVSFTFEKYQMDPLPTGESVTAIYAMFPWLAGTDPAT